MTRLALPLALALALAAFAKPPAARALEPKKPSQLVVLVQSDACNSGEGILLGDRLAPDGSAAPFEIPQGQVLVVTRWTYGFAGGPGSGVAILAPVGGNTVAVSPLRFDANGVAGETVELTRVLTPGLTLCSTHNAGSGVGPTHASVEGFLTKDK